jgi:hypothetical protein
MQQMPCKAEPDGQRTYDGYGAHTKILGTICNARAGRRESTTCAACGVPQRNVSHAPVSDALRQVRQMRSHLVPSAAVISADSAQVHQPPAAKLCSCLPYKRAQHSIPPAAFATGLSFAAHKTACSKRNLGPSVTPTKLPTVTPAKLVYKRPPACLPTTIRFCVSTAKDP